MLKQAEIEKFWRQAYILILYINHLFPVDRLKLLDRTLLQYTEREFRLCLENINKVSSQRPVDLISTLTFSVFAWFQSQGVIRKNNKVHSTGLFYIPKTKNLDFFVHPMFYPLSYCVVFLFSGTPLYRDLSLDTFSG